MGAPRVLGRARVGDAAGIPLPDLLSELPERARASAAAFFEQEALFFGSWGCRSLLRPEGNDVYRHCMYMNIYIYIYIYILCVCVCWEDIER